MSLTPKQEKFAQCVADGMTQSDAYRASFSCEKSKPETIQANASRLMANSMVAARVSILKASLADKALWKREDSVKALIEVVTDRKVRPNDKTGAIKVLNEMHGFNAPIKHELDVDAKVSHKLDVSGLSLEELRVLSAIKVKSE